MDRVAIFVDAGYLFAQGSKEISGRQLRRGETSLDHQALIRALKAFAEKISGLPLLRIYWYDGRSARTTSACSMVLPVRKGIPRSGSET